MVTQIMVPLDGSDLAEQALPCAQGLAEATGATLHLVRVVEPLPGRLYVAMNVYGASMSEQIAEAQDYLNAVRTRLSPSRVPVRAIYLVGETTIVLSGYQQRAAIDLVVMSSHGRNGTFRLIHGSVAAGLVRDGYTPVLLVRPFGEVADLDRVILPLDGSRRAEAALGVLEMLAGRVVHQVTLLRVIAAAADGPSAEKYLDGVRQRLGPLRVACATTVLLGDAGDQIIACADSTAVILMATHGRTGIARWALGSVADRVARSGVASVLLVHPSGASATLSAPEKQQESVADARAVAMPSWALGTRLRLPFGAALAATRLALLGQHLHVLAEIDLTQATRAHVHVVLGPTVILCAYNPELADQALQDDPACALLLPRNVIVYANGERTSTVEALDPDCLLAIAEKHQALAAIVRDAGVRLQRAIDQLAAEPHC